MSSLGFRSLLDQKIQIGRHFFEGGLQQIDRSVASCNIGTAWNSTAQRENKFHGLRVGLLSESQYFFKSNRSWIIVYASVTRNKQVSFLVAFSKPNASNLAGKMQQENSLSCST